jgi:hypothetical protein
MQKWFSIIPILIAFILPCSSVRGADEEKLLTKADSLYEKNKFAEAQALYSDLYGRGYFTNASLLKMAFVLEGLGQTSQALFFLTDYFNRTEDEKAYDKIQTLAKAGGLAGYQLSDFERIAMWLKNRGEIFVPTILAISLFFVALAFYSSKQGWQNSKVVSALVSTFFVGSFLYAINFGSPTSKGVIVKPTYMMTGPSAASNLIALMADGHQVSLGGSRDVWVRVSWNGKEGYIKKNDLMVFSE